MRLRHPVSFLAVGASAVALSLTGNASAQIDVNPPIPNVLLLIDTSGSMENMIDGTRPEDNTANKCSPGVTTPMNRWASLVSVLTGTIENYSCSATTRDATFALEYALNGKDPYDKGYYLPFHRILSNGCTIGPGTAPLNWWDWPTTGLKQHDWSSPTTACLTPFGQAADGLLDTFRDRVRFGLMTFDTLPDASSGISGTGLDAAGGEKGMWSYFPGWAGGGTSVAKGNPPNCAISDYEVGARNGAAPPWEGRLIPFGPYDATLDNVKQSNDHIQQAIVAMRPYGATPVAGMLTDAQYFLLGDTTTDPSTTKAFGPKDDPYFIGGCRKTYIILLSDGEPNQDMKPECLKQGGVCPYGAPEDIARDLANNSDTNKRVSTYVVGFGLSKAGSVDCSKLTSADLTTSTCTNATGALKACCTLTKIAYNGGTENAYFADDITGLRKQLSTVLGAIAAGSTARTYPVFATATAAAATGTAGAAGYQFLSSFNAPAGGAMWSGNLERERYVCETVSGVLEATLQDVDASKGDDFAANINSNDGSHPRQFFSVVGTKDSTLKIWSNRSIRPTLTTDDGLGLAGGTPTNSSGTLADSTTFSTAFQSAPEALGIDSITPPSTCNTTLKATSASQCAERLMRWEIGLSNANTPTETRNPSGCPVDQTCSMLGSIYHATPAIVGPPLDFLRDESYSTFAVANSKRATVLYTATTDGQLHAFKIAPGDTADPFKVDGLQNNELWSFFPPYVLPGLLPTYNQQTMLLDGAPVVKEVVFERTKAQAIAGYGPSGASWNTVLVAGGGGAGGFYYALDITDPLKPKFLWQLSTDVNGNALFGKTTPQPAIATITLKDGTSSKEVAVAILPGGTASLLAGKCQRQQSSWAKLKSTHGYQARSEVRCWGETGSTSVGPARSLTIVRLDNGQILMNFRGALADGPPAMTSNVKAGVAQDAALDSPISGVPVAYPSQIGEVANRVYVGDADGTMWRVDLADPDPTKWKIELAWDAYSMQGDDYTKGEPIQTTPVLSIDAIGNPVILFSTGDQELFTTTTPVTRVWSLTEKPVGLSYEMSENWVIPFTAGKRVTGPLSLFNGVVYFASFTPTLTGQASCTDGYGSVWGVDYVQSEMFQGVPYPLKQFVKDPLKPTDPKEWFEDQPAGTVVFGVGVTQTPACSLTDSFPDPYLGQQHMAISAASEGKYQLVYQTGKGGTASNKSKTNTQTKALPPPRVSTRIDSWASIVE